MLYPILESSNTEKNYRSAFENTPFIAFEYIFYPHVVQLLFINFKLILFDLCSLQCYTNILHYKTLQTVKLGIANNENMLKYLVSIYKTHPYCFPMDIFIRVLCTVYLSKHANLNLFSHFSDCVFTSIPMIMTELVQHEMPK